MTKEINNTTIYNYINITIVLQSKSRGKDFQLANSVGDVYHCHLGYGLPYYRMGYKLLNTKHQS